MLRLLSPQVLFGVPFAMALFIYMIRLPYIEAFWEYRTSAFAPWFYMVFFGVIFVLFASVGITLIPRNRRRGLSPPTPLIVFAAYLILWLVSFFSLMFVTFRYCHFYGGLGKILESLIAGRLTLGKGEVMEKATIPGVTTLVHLAPAAAVLGTIAVFHSPNRLVRLLIAVTGILSLAMLFIISWIICERLLFLEVLLPMVILWLSRRKRSLIRPLILMTLSLILISFWFVTTITRESYFRREAFKTEYAFLALPVMRLCSYFSSNVGNAMYVVEHPLPPQFPRYAFPMSQEFLGAGDEVTTLFTSGKLNRANNTFGLAGSLFMDIRWLSLAVVVVLSALVGALFSLYVNGSFYATLVYPATCLGLVDGYRTGTLLEVRVLLPVAALTVVYIIYRLSVEIRMKCKGEPRSECPTSKGVLV